MKVTLVPAQMLDPGLAAILTLTGRFELTAIVSVLEVAGLPVVQVRSEVRTHVTASLLASVELV
ncbi:hypothetical protein SDC9_88411 [bioreactor metagenome]|uniref:Uncharacterized protein n=1 Tax=bioreactor metagenome TaxID=1076179 RepID=A0A644ZLI4_9ZZZZ